VHILKTNLKKDWVYLQKSFKHCFNSPPPDLAFQLFIVQWFGSVIEFPRPPVDGISRELMQIGCESEPLSLKSEYALLLYGFSKFSILIG
jgi:hypothetical protein